MTAARCSHQGAVDRHFAGRLPVAGERQMRSHLVDCAACRDRYARHLKLAAVDPGALGFEERLRRGLGLTRPRLPITGGALAAFGGLLALGAVLLLPRLRGTLDRLPAEADDDLGGWRARGAGAAQVALALALDRHGTAVTVFRTSGEGAPAPIVDRIDARTELAFALRNRGGWGRLMVFARDQRGTVFWYHPQWTKSSDNPVAIEVTSTPDLQELPAAIRHPFAAGKLWLCALVSRQALSVRQVENELTAHAGAAPGVALSGADRGVACQSLEVAP